MGVISFIKSAVTLLKTAKKPTAKEYNITLRITLLGLAIIGTLTFLIRFLALAFQPA
ncbi:MAG: protein translocase SEC61 complex subunit gamma [Candidatus Caldarchaeum sp.]|nr:protein translocase SEC61 complex subunit gamma [Candidatus Caldarchaeum sp.]MCS7133339.1 protein translocase SEC61 complex subunit gamma [Candidatus Caldarchaeum sp.]MCX8200481.1 protein translocase SEC61 complex subunit gamma [Candidatus Caldarchaeum sp.]MDW8062710.1 protein translocase SEC61 complex subunit gamma [Candidatus Caldarchaeum sp.]MDW8435115.1 protein translocase SEC61 complex subunit gamma [Candidatus Caldarchaeum sp.]